MYTIPVLWMLSWPVLIIISLLLVTWSVKKYKKRLEEEESADQ